MPKKRFVVVESPEGNSIGTAVLPIGWVVKNGWLGDGKTDAESKSIGNDLAFWPKLPKNMKILRTAMKNPNIKPAEETTIPHRCKIRKYFATRADVSVYF